MIELRRLNLEIKSDMDKLNEMTEQYYKEVCTPDELAQEIADLYDDTLNAEVIEQTRREKDPFYIMGIENDGEWIGFIAYTVYHDEGRCFIDNFYIAPEQRNRGLGTAAYHKAEQHIRGLGATTITLLPEDRAMPFYQRLGFSENGTTKDGASIFRKLFPHKKNI